MECVRAAAELAEREREVLDKGLKDGVGVDLEFYILEDRYCLPAFRDK